MFKYSWQEYPQNQPCFGKYYFVKTDNAIQRTIGYYEGEWDKPNVTHFMEIEYPPVPVPKIKPCPACNCTEAKLEKFWDINEHKGDFIICIKCGLKLFSKSKKLNDLGKLWNSMEC
jgi:hypothetical protein